MALASADDKSRVATVLAAATDLFAQSTGHAPARIRQFSELATNMVVKAEEPLRRRMAGLLAGHPDTPHPLLELLARDVLAVAAPVLATENALTSGFLISLVEDGEEARIGVIAKRPNLDDCVREAIAKAGFASDKEEDAEEPASDDDDAVGLAIATMDPEAPPLPFVMPTLEDILAWGSNRCLQAIVDTEREAMRRIAGGQQAPGVDAPDAEWEAGLIETAGARTERRGDYLTLLAETCAIGVELAERLVDDEGGEAFVLALKAARVSEKTITGLLLLSNPAIGRSEERVRGLSKLASAMSCEAAAAIARPEAQKTGDSRHLPLAAETVRDARRADSERSGLSTVPGERSKPADKPAAESA